LISFIFGEGGICCNQRATNIDPFLQDPFETLPGDLCGTPLGPQDPPGTTAKNKQVSLSERALEGLHDVAWRQTGGAQRVAPKGWHQKGGVKRVEEGRVTAVYAYALHSFQLDRRLTSNKFAERKLKAFKVVA